MHRVRSLGPVIVAGGMVLMAACTLGESNSSSSCTLSASCQPEGLLLHMTWAENEAWPTQSVVISGVVVGEPDAWFSVECVAGQCSLACRGEPAASSGCFIPLGAENPAAGETDGEDTERELEVQARFESRSDGEGPTINVTRHERTPSSEERRWPDDLHLEIDGPDGGHRWEFAPPTVNLFAGGSGGPGCFNEVCDGLIREIVVGLLEPT